MKITLGNHSQIYKTLIFYNWLKISILKLIKIKKISNKQNINKNMKKLKKKLNMTLNILKLFKIK